MGTIFLEATSRSLEIFFEKNSLKRNMASTYTFLAKITTLIVAVCLGSGFVCSLISMLESGHFSPVFFGIAVLFMAWFVLEYVGLHCKIRFLIIWSCIIWVNFATHFIRKLIDVSVREQLSMFVLKGNYDLIWAIPLMLFACFKAGVQILLTME